LTGQKQQSEIRSQELVKMEFGVIQNTV